MRHEIKEVGKKRLLGTGIKDQNNNKIFEGDELQYKDKVYTLRFCGLRLEFMMCHQDGHIKATASTLLNSTIVR